MPDGDGNESKKSQSAVFRVSVVLLLVIIAFITIRQMSVPKSFGQYGYYRGNNVEEWVAMPPRYASGSQACVKCHADESNALASAQHAQLGCQSCHGPLMAHVQNPRQSHPKVAGNAGLCGACHRQLVGRPDSKIRTVRVGEHSGGLECTKCHDPHRPLAMLGGGKW